jgi:hypothetical protein
MGVALVANNQTTTSKRHMPSDSPTTANGWGSRLGFRDLCNPPSLHLYVVKNISLKFREINGFGNKRENMISIKISFEFELIREITLQHVKK